MIPLQKESIKGFMEEQLQKDALPFPSGLSLGIFQSINSTNTELLEDPRTPRAIFSEFQTKPRGRFENRRFESDAFQNLLMSVSFKLPKVFCQNIGLVALLSGLLVLEVIKTLDPKIKLSLKWPNDFVVPQTSQKAGGILVETEDDKLVLGIGMNVHAQRAPLGLKKPFSSLSLLSKVSWNRNQLGALILCSLFKNLPKLQEEGFKPFLKRYQEALWLQKGEKIWLMAKEVKQVYFFEGVAEDGALLVFDQNKILKSFYSAEVSLKESCE